MGRLLEVGDLANVSVRVLPLSAGPQPGGGRRILRGLDFPATKGGRAAPEPSVVYRESLIGALYLDKPDELRAYEDAWKGIAALALSDGESRDMIKRIVGELQHD
ncbi:Scr1 family TA system antitoxin-like transcriptional regulator [Micromonospora sp. NPDC005163]